MHVDAAPGVVKVVAAWMLDSTECSAMELGEPRVTVAALSDLHRLLVASPGAYSRSAVFLL